MRFFFDIMKLVNSMNGNRGAKGSVRDRLISMLYRMRYKKKELKESEYTIESKKKQAEYLKTLKQFSYSNDPSILPLEDKKALDDIRFKAHFKEELPGEFRLKSLESTKSLPQEIDLEKEQSKTEDEIVILKEVKDFINKSLDNIKDINDSIDVIKKSSKEKNQNTEQLEKEYEELRKKVKKLKEQFDVASQKYDLSDFSILESIKLISGIEDYKSLASLNEMEMLLKVCKKEISKIDGITISYDTTAKVGADIDSLKQEQKQVKIKFNKEKEKINQLDSIEEVVKKELEYQKSVIDEMYTKASFFEKEVRTKVEYSGYGKILSSVARIAGGILTIPFTGLKLFGISLGATMVNKGLKQLNKGLERKEKMVIDYNYEDLSKKISGVKDKLEYTNLVLTDSLNEIEKLKSNLKNYFSEFDVILPEYSEMLKRIEEIEKSILLQQTKLGKMDKKLREEDKMNKEKMQKVKNYNSF